MLSAIVLVPEDWPGQDLALEREIVVRSLVWLVSAVVAGVVRDVTLAVPPGLGLGEVADQAGCNLVTGATEAERLGQALAAARESRLILLKAGFHPEDGVIEELEAFERHRRGETVAALLAEPERFIERLFPNTSPAAGLVLSRVGLKPSGFDALVRARRRGGTVLKARARSIV